MQNNEQAETIEFLKIRLMERDRQISDFEAKSKKTEFKHSRDLKEAKIAEDRAKALLKDEKAKVDRLTKLAKENQQQNHLLNLRLAELRQEKERQLSDIRMQYNSLKEEVRSYERILPTLTFMNELNLNIADIPPYEDVFIKQKEKGRQLKELRQKTQEMNKNNREQIQLLRQNEQLLKNKKVEVERALKEVLPKLIDSEQQISELKTTNEEFQAVIEQLKQQIHVLQQKSQSLESTVREYELKLEELDRAYSCELLSKQQEIRALTQQEFDRYENEIQSLENRLQIKDNMYLQQVQILEEEVYYLQNRITEEKEHFQENYLLIKAEIDRMREEVDHERQEHEWLKSKHQEALKQLATLEKGNQLLQNKIAILQKRIERYRQNETNSAKAFSDVQLSKLQNLQQSYNQLLQQHQHLTINLSRAIEENKAINQQAALLRVQLSSKATPQSQTLELPSHFLQFQELIKRKSGQYDKLPQIQIPELQIHTNQIKGQKQKHRPCELDVIAQEEIQQSGSYKKIQMEFESKIAELMERVRKQSEELNLLKKQKECIAVENIELKKQLIDCTEKLSSSQQNLITQSKNYSFLKNKSSALQKQNGLLCEQAKRDKQLIKSLRQQQKQLKEMCKQQTEKFAKERKDLHSQFQSLKSAKDAVRLQFAEKQKNYLQELTTLRNLVAKNQKYQNQVQNLKEELENYKSENRQLSHQCKDYLSITEDLKRQNSQLGEVVRLKSRENSSLHESLDRQRKERTLVAVPSLQKIQKSGKDETFNDIYGIVTQKESQINFLEREISDLKEEIQGLKVSQNIKMEAMENQQNSYIQTIIDMKMRCAEAQMKASQSIYLYSKLKKKIGENNTT